MNRSPSQLSLPLLRGGTIGLCAILLLLAPARRGDARTDGAAQGAAVSVAAAVTITEPWARATPAGARMGAIYLKLLSPGGDRLLQASVPRSVAAKTQIHETLRHAAEGGGESMEMRQVASVELPAGQEVALEPGGFHVMLMGLKRGLKAGEHVSVTLRFEKAGSRTVTADVRGF